MRSCKNALHSGGINFHILRFLLCCCHYNIHPFFFHCEQLQLAKPVTSYSITQSSTTEESFNRQRSNLIGPLFCHRNNSLMLNRPDPFLLPPPKKEGKGP